MHHELITSVLAGSQGIASGIQAHLPGALDGLATVADAGAKIAQILTKLFTYGKLIAGGTCAWKLIEEMGGEGNMATKFKACLPYGIIIIAIAGLSLAASGDGGFGDVLGGWNF